MIAAPGYPEEVIVECSPPVGYPETWSYSIWMSGVWAQKDNVTKCIDPNLCYDDPPGNQQTMTFYKIDPCWVLIHKNIDNIVLCSTSG